MKETAALRTVALAGLLVSAATVLTLGYRAAILIMGAN